jgi:uncharacterized membrane protein YccF (DUF307 family)
MQPRDTAAGGNDGEGAVRQRAGLPWARAAFNIAAYTLLPFGYKALRATNISAAKMSALALWV